MKSQGSKFRKAVLEEKPLQIIGVINPYVAIMAEHTGYQAIYLSGAGVANASHGLADLGLTTLSEVLDDVRRITEACSLPLLVDADTGWGSSLMAARTVKMMISAKAAAMHIEDQPHTKRCGHRMGKSLISKEEMVERIKACVDAKTDPDFVIMARTDAVAVEGLDKAIERAIAYVEAGADMIFPEALTELSQYLLFRQNLNIPILANLTEFGKTPLFTLDELRASGIDMALYPLSVNRAMNLAALKVLEEIRCKGTQLHLLEMMQTREELYGFLNYEASEKLSDLEVDKCH